jgi:hypothetical protein
MSHIVNQSIAEFEREVSEGAYKGISQQVGEITQLAQKLECMLHGNNCTPGTAHKEYNDSENYANGYFGADETEIGY